MSKLISSPFLIIFALLFLLATLGKESSKKGNEIAVPFEITATGYQTVVMSYKDQNFTMILDTGASVNVLSNKIVKTNNFEVTSSDYKVMGVGSEELDLARISPITASIANKDFIIHDLITIDLSNIDSITEIQGVDGLLGIPFFQKYNARIDFAAKKVYLTLPPKSK